MVSLGSGGLWQRLGHTAWLTHNTAQTSWQIVGTLVLCHWMHEMLCQIRPNENALDVMYEKKVAQNLVRSGGHTGECIAHIQEYRLWGEVLLLTSQDILHEKMCGSCGGPPRAPSELHG